MENMRVPPLPENLKGKVAERPGEFFRNGKRYIRVITNDSVRDLIIPNPEPNVNAAVFCPEEIKEIAGKKRHGSQEKAEQMISSSKQREEEAKKSAMRKKELQSFPAFKEFGQRLNKLEQEAEAKANFLLNRAKEIRTEDNDDVKLCNKLILRTKCQAIRDAQVAEKKIIEQELLDEEKRLDAMMEQERKRMLAKEISEKNNDNGKKESYKKAINEQVKGNELEREMEAERLVEENKIVKEAIIQNQIDELKAFQKKAEEKKKIREELNRINQHILERIEDERNAAKLADLKIQEFMRQKDLMEQQREEELKEVKAKREQELVKVRNAQKKLLDDKAGKDASRAQRLQEQYEREWRDKEKAVQLEKKRKSEQLKLERLKQIEEKKKTQAIEAEREKRENLKVLIVDEQIAKKEKEEEEKRKIETEIYKAGLLKQINEKEYERIKQKQAQFEEGINLNMEMKSNEEFLKSIIRKKLAALRTHNVPEKYIQDIERHFKL